MRPVIQSIKHINQHHATAVAQGAVTTFDEAIAVKDYTGSAVNVPVGAVVKAIYVEMWVLSDTSAFGNVVVTVEKRKAGQVSMTAAQSTALDSYPNKANVFYTTEGLTPPNVANPMPFIRGWIKIPKGKQRMALGDTICVNVSAVVIQQEICGLSIYKHYT